MSWDPTVYSAFLGPRTRPAADLCANVVLSKVDSIIDVGCGPGNSTEVLAARWPGASVLGIDSSVAMIDRARAMGPAGARWQVADAGTFEPDAPVDVVFSNATFQWLAGHEVLFPRVLGWVRPGGVLAVQMPRNFGAPSHVLLREVAARPRFRDRLAGVLRTEPVHRPEWYYRTLSDLASLDLWETEYLHVLDGADPVLEWVSGTALVPVRDALPDAEYDAFRAEYGAALREAYPRGLDGQTLFPFRRLFLVATPR